MAAEQGVEESVAANAKENAEGIETSQADS